MAIFNSYFVITRGYRNLQIPPGTPHPRGVGTPRHGAALQRCQLRAAGAAHGRGRGRRGGGVGGTRPNGNIFSGFTLSHRIQVCYIW